MPATWKTVRVFISSTLRDMPFDTSTTLSAGFAQGRQAERDHLVKVMFPAPREQMMPYHVTVVVINE